MRKYLAVVMALLITLSVTVPVASEGAALSDDIVILYTNDVHTYIDGPLSYDVIAALKSKLKTQYKYVLLADAGDHIQGRAYGSMDDGETIIELMNTSGYDVATLGNHEFDYGMFGCMKAIDRADFPYVSCNFYHEENGVRTQNVLDSYTTFDCGSETVAILGITTPESITKSTPAYFQDENGNYIYGIAGGNDGKDLYADVQSAIDDARSAGATKVIALGHLGDGLDSKPWTSEETIANVSGLAAFIDGHSHSTVKGKSVSDKDGNNVLLTQTGEYFNRIGMMIIDSDTGEISTDFIECREVLDSDGETVLGYELVSDLYTDAELIRDGNVKAIKDAWISDVDTELSTNIGSAEIILDNYDPDGKRLVRSQETNTGDFCADALYYLFDEMDMDVDIAIMNGGGIRNKAVTGDLSYKTCKDIHTFGNVACLQTVTGQQILDALEWGARFAGESENGGFLQVSGITYKIDCSVPDTIQTDDKGIWVGGPTGDYRVYDVKVYNKSTNAWDDIDLEASYNLAGYNYTLRDLGDGFSMFDGAVNVLDYVMEDYMVLSNYVAAFEDDVVKASNSPLAVKYSGFTVDYGTVDGSGRIEINSVREGKIIIGGLDNDIWFSKHGNVYLSCDCEDFFDEMGFAMGDIVTVRFLDKELTVPVVPTYAYVDNGTPAVIVHLNDSGAPTGKVALAINMGNFGETYGLAVKNRNDNGDWWWEAADGVTYPVEVTFEMADKGGYKNGILMRDLTGSNNREDYAHLTDTEFANFRVIDTTGMGKNKLYRTSSPINPELNRNTYALDALEEAGVTVVMNLADSAEGASAYEGFEDSYYANQKVIYLNLGVDFAGQGFRDGLAKGLRFFAENEGVYAVHCNYGKDRAGFVSALLECFIGASYEEVVADYMVTYYNYYGVEPGTEKYRAIAEGNIIDILSEAFEVDDLSKADLQAEATEYIRSLGLNDSEIKSLKINLGAPDTLPNPPQVENDSQIVDNPETRDNNQIGVYWWMLIISTTSLTALNSAQKRK